VHPLNPLHITWLEPQRKQTSAYLTENNDRKEHVSGFALLSMMLNCGVKLM